MGWSSGWSMMEEQIIGVYDTGALTLPVLQAILNPYKNTDIDGDGSTSFLTKDGKNVFDVVLEVASPETYQALKNKEYPAGDDASIDDMDVAYREVRKMWPWF